MTSVIVLADDLSGAAELAGLAFGHGLSAEVQREISVASPSDVIAVDAGSRQLEVRAAEKRQRALASQLRHFSRALLFKKVDSLLRGNVRAELEALMQAAGYRRAILVPANPSRGRTVINGQYLIHGQPLHESPLAQDPHHPRQTADIAALLGEGLEALHIASAGCQLPPTGIIVPDAAAPEDLARLADEVDDLTLAAGAADFFAHVLETRTNRPPVDAPCPDGSLPAPPALLVCGSRLAWPARRQAAVAANLTLIECDGAGLFPADSTAYALGFGDREVSPQTALRAISSLAATIIGQLQIRTILAEGGETAAALAAKLGWKRFQVVGNAPAGVGVLRPLTDPTPVVYVKPGSYAWPAEIWNAFAGIESA